MTTSVERAIVPALGVARVVIGTGLLVSPVGLARGLGIDAETARRVGWMARMAGAREVALGLGTLQAWRRDEPLDGWVAGQAISDGVDAVAFAVTAARGRRRPGPRLGARRLRGQRRGVGGRHGRPAASIRLTAAHASAGRRTQRANSARSMLPPHSTVPTCRPRSDSASARAAASPAAPAPSARLWVSVQ